MKVEMTKGKDGQMRGKLNNGGDEDGGERTKKYHYEKKKHSYTSTYVKASVKIGRTGMIKGHLMAQK